MFALRGDWNAFPFALRAHKIKRQVGDDLLEWLLATTKVAINRDEGGEQPQKEVRDDDDGGDDGGGAPFARARH
ncbi:MAG: hypothetical protein THHGLFOP_000719 [Candidatus Fervidibacter sp.]